MSIDSESEAGAEVEGVAKVAETLPAKLGLQHDDFPPTAPQCFLAVRARPERLDSRSPIE